MVTNIRGIHGAPMSEATIAYMLSLTRDMPRVVHAQDRPAWERWPAALLDGKTVGILGVGVIAEHLAPMCKAFNMTVIGISSAPRPGKGFDRMVDRRDLVKVARELDYLVVLIPVEHGYPQHHRRGAARRHEAERLPDQHGARRRGRRAGLDRMRWKAARSPAPRSMSTRRNRCRSDSPLWKTKNLQCFPHLGGYSEGYEERAMPTIEGNMRKYLAGDLKSMINIVRKPASWT